MKKLLFLLLTALILTVSCKKEDVIEPKYKYTTTYTISTTVIRNGVTYNLNTAQAYGIYMPNRTIQYSKEQFSDNSWYTDTITFPNYYVFVYEEPAGYTDTIKGKVLSRRYEGGSTIGIYITLENNKEIIYKMF